MTSVTRSAKATDATQTQQTESTPERGQYRLIRKVLIANRGEIACRVMRTCRAMGIATVAVCSDADANARHVHEADEALHVGGSAAVDSYLNVPALLAAAARVGADAVHPGYGFLSENAAFAAACRAAHLIFIGPQSDVIARMGSKIEAKRIATAAGVPVVPGYLGVDQTDERFLAESRSIGYPVLVKASAGGGGKGMRVVEREADLSQALAAARREARSAFGDDTLLLEKLISGSRHIEVQIFGDEHGNVIHLGERECSIQRRHQKVIEETPSTALTPDLRVRMTAAAVAIGEQLHYDNAGTVEFILDSAGDFYFLEVNTRLQVEHPVTEFVTRLDLVRWQIRVAEGHPLPLAQSEVTFSGHAVEARLYAEVPEADFLPASGPILLWSEPTGEGVRVESGVQSGDTISPFYDPLLAKIVVYGEDRAEALRKLDRTLSKTTLLGIPSNRDFLRRLILHPDHLAGRISTEFIEEHRDDLIRPALGAHERAALRTCATDGAIITSIRRLMLTNRPTHWRNNLSRPILERFNLVEAASDADGVNSLRVEVRVVPVSTSQFDVECDTGGVQSSHSILLLGQRDNQLDVELDRRRLAATILGAEDEHWWVALGDEIVHLIRLSPFPVPHVGSPTSERALRGALRTVETTASPGTLAAPLPGQVVAVLVAIGQAVRAGDPLVVLEAMKMEHVVRAPRDGEVVTLFVSQGDQTRHGSPMLEIRAKAAREVGL